MNIETGMIAPRNVNVKSSWNTRLVLQLYNQECRFCSADTCQVYFENRWAMQYEQVYSRPPAPLPESTDSSPLKKGGGGCRFWVTWYMWGLTLISGFRGDSGGGGWEFRILDFSFLDLLILHSKIFTIYASKYLCMNNCMTWLEKHGIRGNQTTSNFKSKLQVWPF